MNRSERWLERRLNRWKTTVSGGTHNPEAIWLAQQRAMLIACAFGVPTLLCLWVYTLLYMRQNLFLLYLPLVLASVILSVTVQSLGQSINRRASGLAARSGELQTRLLSWSVLLYTTLCLGYRALAPDHFNDGLNLLVALLVVATGITVCARFRPLRAGLTLAALTFVHSLPLLGGLRGHALSGGPLLLGVVTELMLSTVLALMYSASWTQLALGQSEAASVQMEYQSRTDHLTKLSNRRSLYSQIEALMAEMKEGQTASALGKPASGVLTSGIPVAGGTVAGGTVAGGTVAGGTTDVTSQRIADHRAEQTFSVVLLDIDHFKTVNDTFGHASGDAVLCEVAEILGSFMRRRDVAGRWGGEEFLLVIPGTALDRAARIAERLRACIESARMLPLHDSQAQVMQAQVPTGQGPSGHTTNHSVTASFGVASYQPGDSLEALLARADAAMYRAKRGGRNRVEVGVPAPPGARSVETHPLPGGATERLLEGPLGPESPAPELTGTDG